jgi:oligoribonuclease
LARLVFLDLETTGKDCRLHEILEVACVVTDDSFRELDSFEVLLRAPAMHESMGGGLRNWTREARDMHERSGLLMACSQRGISESDAEVLLRYFLKPHKAAGDLHLAGNSVHFDRGFLKKHWPQIEEMFHHRHLDVSSLRMLGERLTDVPKLDLGNKPHRAMSDVRHSIVEMWHWAQALKFQKDQREGTL